MRKEGSMTFQYKGRLHLKTVWESVCLSLWRNHHPLIHLLLSWFLPKKMKKRMINRMNSRVTSFFFFVLHKKKEENAMGVSGSFFPHDFLSTFSSVFLIFETVVVQILACLPCWILPWIPFLFLHRLHHLRHVFRFDSWFPFLLLLRRREEK